MGLGRLLIAAGIILVVVGVLVILGQRLPVRLGRLPGDIELRGKNFVFYFPLATCLIVSAILTLIFWLLRR